MNELEKLRAKEATIKKRIAQIQARGKAEERRQRTARLIKFGIVIEAMLKSGELNMDEWISTCRGKLNERDFELATAKLRPVASSDGALKEVQPMAGTSCAPAAGGDA